MSASGSLTYDEGVEFLTRQIPNTSDRFHHQGESLERSRALLALLDKPQDEFASIHIAGTSGKGTVAYMIDELLRGAGKSTGRHVSPHVYDIRERAIVDGEFVSEQVFADVVSMLLDPIETIRDTVHGYVTYYEVMSVLAFLLFRRKAIDYGVIETGMGGRYDPTNAITRSDKLAVITKLGLDHTEVLGATVEAIADQKAGIMPLDGDAIVWKPETSEVRQVMERVAAERSTKLRYVDASFFTITDYQQSVITMTYHDEERSVDTIVLPPGGLYQAENAAVALRSALFLASRDGFTLDDDTIRRALAGVQIPGRFEKRQVFNQDVIFDGAHNPQKIAALLAALDPDERPIFVVALKKTKEARTMFDQIARHADKIITTQFFSDHEGVTASFAYSASDLAEIARSAGADVRSYADNLAALRKACKLALPGQRIVVTGSFYFLGELHDRLRFMK